MKHVRTGSHHPAVGRRPSSSRPESRLEPSLAVLMFPRGQEGKKKKVNKENTEPLRWCEEGKEARMVKAGSSADELPPATRCPLGFPGKWDENARTVFTTSPTSSVGCVPALGRARAKGNSLRGLMLFHEACCQSSDSLSSWKKGGFVGEMEGRKRLRGTTSTINLACTGP